MLFFWQYYSTLLVPHCDALIIWLSLGQGIGTSGNRWTHQRKKRSLSPHNANSESTAALAKKRGGGTMMMIHVHICTVCFRFLSSQKREDVHDNCDTIESSGNCTFVCRCVFFTDYSFVSEDTFAKAKQEDIFALAAFTLFPPPAHTGRCDSCRRRRKKTRVSTLNV